MNFPTSTSQPQLIPIKIKCACGQKYAFDIELNSPRLTYGVNCPVCGADGTAAANQILTDHLASFAAPVAGLRIGTQSAASESSMPSARFTAGTNSTSVKHVNKWIAPKIGAAVVLLLLVGFVFMRSQGPKVDASIDGLPHTPTELNAWYLEPPAGQNAAVFFLQGIEALQIGHVTPALSQGKLTTLGVPLPASTKAALASLVRSNRDAMQFFLQGSQYELSRYPVNLSQGIEATFPHLLKVRRATQATELAAIFYADNKDGDQAAKGVLMTLCLARSLKAEPSLLSQSARATGISNAVAALEQTVNRTVLSQESLKELSQAFQKMEASEARGESFGRALIGERVTTVALFETPQKIRELLSLPGVDLPAAERAEIDARLQKNTPLKAERRFYDETFRQLMQARKKDFPARLKSGDWVRERSAQAADKKLGIARWLLPGLAAPVGIEAGCVAQLRLGLTSLALERFRLAHENRYPATLSELSPEFLSILPIDPFDGQPMKYSVKGKSYVLYSIGPDRKDDSGQRINGREGDIVFEVSSPNN